MRTVVTMSLAGGLLCAMPALADVYSCHSETFCTCNEADGCNGLDQHLHARPTATCREHIQVFEAKAHRRKVILNGENLNITLKEARPTFSDLDWYQAGATDDRGLVNLIFDNESPRTDFLIRQMAQGSVNNNVWTLSGKCEANS